MAAVQLGSETINGKVFLAPMAGVTDLPYRQLSRKHGVAYAVGEMAASKDDLKNTQKTQRRMNVRGETPLRVIQLLGADPQMLANAARRAVDAGAQVIDLNCGCPAKKVCSVACGSALLRTPDLVGRLLEAIINAVSVPVTLKFRLGWDADSINALEVGKMAEDLGVAMLVLHGRTREQGFRGHATYDVIRELKKVVHIPVIANGDIDSPQKAKRVLEETGADGVMIGRAAMGNPWLLGKIRESVEGIAYPDPTSEQIIDTVCEHINIHYDFYGFELGQRTIRKHLNLYLSRFGVAQESIYQSYQAQSPEAQIQIVRDLLEAVEPTLKF